jgi:hypothetical protein
VFQFEARRSSRSVHAGSPHARSLHIRERITHVAAGGVGKCGETLHNLGVLGGDIVLFARVIVEIEQRQLNLLDPSRGASRSLLPPTV